KYVATTPSLSNARDNDPQARDKLFENQILRNRDELLYVELSHAMNAGDIGCVEASILPWVHMFKATGKHKYASQMLHFMINMRDVYPPELQRIIRMNWLCNPTGKDHGFRGVDWLHIIKESPLIEFYRRCHVAIEDSFHLEHRTIRHSHSDMTNTIKKLCEKMHKNGVHVFKPGR
ncbi:hypothetical protein BDQ17DRAFT_1194111, partial [Cyathus striatus]